MSKKDNSVFHNAVEFLIGVGVHSALDCMFRRVDAQTQEKPPQTSHNEAVVAIILVPDHCSGCGDKSYTLNKCDYCGNLKTFKYAITQG